MFKLVKSLLRGKPRQERQTRQVRPASYVPLYAPGEGEIFPDFSRVSRVVPSFALRVETEQLRVCSFEDRVFLFTPERVMVCDQKGQQEAYFEAPGLILNVHAVDPERLLCLSSGSSQVLNWQEGGWSECGSDFRSLRGLAWLGKELLGFFPSVPGEESVFRVKMADWTLETLVDPTFEGRLRPFSRIQKDGTVLSSFRLDPTTELQWKCPHPLGPSQGPPSNPAEKVWRVLFDPAAPSAPQVGRPRLHWATYPSHQQEQGRPCLASARQGSVLGLLEQGTARVVVFWNNPELIPVRCRVCEAWVPVDRTGCLCGAQPPATGVRALNRPLLLAADFEESWSRYLELRSEPVEQRVVPAGFLQFGHLQTLLKPVRERYFQVGLLGPEGWEGGQVLEDVSTRAEVKDGLCLHVHGRDFQMLTTLTEGEVTTLVRGRFLEPAVAAEVSVRHRRLYLGSASGVSEFELGQEPPRARCYDECITYYDGPDGSRRSLNGVKRMALSQCRDFLFVFSGSAHTYRLVDQGLEYLGQEDLLSFYGRRDEQGRVLAHRHGEVLHWSPVRETWTTDDDEVETE